MNRFELYRTSEDTWAIRDTDTGETAEFSDYDTADDISVGLNYDPTVAEFYFWEQPANAPEPWNADGPETMRSAVGEARQLATGLAMLGMNDAATTILNLIKLVEDN